MARHSSTARNASGIAILLAAESSSVLSRMLLEAFMNAIKGITETTLASEHILSDVTGFLLKGIALEPTWASSMGSESSPKVGDWRTLRSRPTLAHEAATEARAARTR